jgi:hypothetical protein
MLRHPVVITTLEEDLKVIGLIKEDETPLTEGAQEMTHGAKDIPRGRGGKTGTGSPGKHRRREGGASDMMMGYEVGGDELNSQSSDREDPSIDYGTTEDEDPDFDELAAAFEEGEEDEEGEFYLDDDEMAEFEEAARYDGGEVTEVTSEVDEIRESLDRIESLMAEGVDDIQAAIPAFANVALLAEKLHGFFSEHGDLVEGADAEGMAEGYADIAKYSAGIVSFLQTENPSTINMVALKETFEDYVRDVVQGLDVYAGITEDDGEDDEVDEGAEEDDEGND